MRSRSSRRRACRGRAGGGRVEAARRDESVLQGPSCTAAGQPTPQLRPAASTAERRPLDPAAITILRMGYVSFLAPKQPAPPPPTKPEPAVEASLVASTSKLARSPSPPPTPAVAPAPAPKSPKAAAKGAAGPSRTNGKRPRVISYLSDDEHEPAQEDDDNDDDDETGVAAARQPSQTVSKVARRAANGDAGSRPAKGKAREGSFAVDKERLRAEKDRLRTTRMELPIWAGPSPRHVAQHLWRAFSDPACCPQARTVLPRPSRTTTLLSSWERLDLERRRVGASPLMSSPAL